MPTEVLGALDAHIEEPPGRSPAHAAEGEALAASALAAAAVAAAAAGGPAAPRNVRRLVAASERLTEADPLRVGLLALGDPLLLSAPLQTALQAHATLLAGIARLDAVSIWITEQESEPTLGAYAGGRTAALHQGGLARAICGAHSDDTLVLVRAGGEPCAVITWENGRADPALGRALAERSARYLELAFERASLLESTVARHAALARSAERRLSRVALDLHDGPLQDLALLRGELASLRTTLIKGKAEDATPRDPLSQLDDLQAIAEATEADLRELAASTDATKLLRRPFDDAVRGVAAAFALRSGIEPAVTLEGSGNDLTATERGTLLRVVGEALANIREHAGAGQVAITVRVGAESVEAQISDDGCGFDLAHTLPAAARRGSMGLLGMVERLGHLGGQCHIDARKGQGTTIHLTFARATPAAVQQLHGAARPARRRVGRAA
jgi:signal transduction histidine kinase